MNATLNPSETQNSMTTAACRTARPKADIYETADAWLLQLDVPGADETSIELTLEKQVLSVKGEAAHSVPEGFEPVYTEFAPRRFERAFRLPTEIDRTEIEATVKDGVLQLKLPKSKEARPQQVAVKAG